jgi:uncharacterized repeat protein (TIGR03803 family)
MNRCSVFTVPRFSHTFIALALLIFCSAFVEAQVETLLHTFPTGSADGFDTSGGLTVDGSGALYGLTHTGGGTCENNSLGCGTAYKLTHVSGGGWAETSLFSFTGGASRGAFPQGNLVFDGAAHVFYGITNSGGAHDNGTAFALTPGSPWTAPIIFNFPLSNTPYQGVVMRNGMLYGISAGGSLGGGLVYRLHPPTSPGNPWRQEILYQFTDGADGAFPQAAPILDSAGNVYGTTLSGPGGIGGTVYKLSPPVSGSGVWTYTNLYTFSGNADGGEPESGVVFDSAGNLYGTTESGGADNFGVVYKLTPPAGGLGAWTEAVLYSFALGTDGGVPYAGVTIDGAGNIYGAAAGGGDLSCGAGAGCGTVFKLTSSGGSWTESVLYSFEGGSDGEEPSYTPLLLGGNLYGTTAAGGGTKNGGIAFEVTP